MLEQYLASPVTRQRLQSGPLADHVTGFAEWLHHHGYRPLSIEQRLRSLAGWSERMCAAEFCAHDVLAAFERCQPHKKKGFDCINKNVRYDHVNAAALYIKFLREQKVIPQPAARILPTERWPLLGSFQSWMAQHRGLRESTLSTYQVVLIDLLEALGDAPLAYTAEALRAFIMRRSQPYGVARAKSIVVAIRTFLRFLEATGRCSSGMADAIPGFASWSLSTVPRFLEPEDVERVVDACNGDAWVRDRAVILLLARLGLRASEVAQITFADIDWTNGRIAVCGKSRRQEWLPLPQEVGDAILLYLQRDRPPLPVPEVFCMRLAPRRPVTRAAVTHIVRSALKRAGIVAPVNGAHLLRHSAATAMLRQGASLAGVGAVLRHRSPATTAHYAKVDFTLLSEIAQPWPGVSSC